MGDAIIKYQIICKYFVSQNNFSFARLPKILNYLKHEQVLYKLRSKIQDEFIPHRNHWAVYVTLAFCMF
jgi:hypothetical protein